MRTQPDISVIIPVYNEEHHIEQAMRSVLDQTVSDVELICVDDGSTDGTVDVIKGLAESDRRIRLLTQHNLGAGPARNKALAECTGRYVAFLDADDYLSTNDVYETLIDTSEKYGVDVCGGYVQYDIDGELSCSDALQNYTAPQVFRYRDCQFDYGFTKNVYASDLIRSNNLRFPALRRFQDPPFLVRALYAAELFAFCPIASYTYRRQNKQIDWTYEKVLDYTRGILDLLSFSREHRLAKLHFTQVTHIEYNWYEAVMAKARLSESEELRDVLRQIDDTVDVRLLRMIKPSIEEPYTIRPLREL